MNKTYSLRVLRGVSSGVAGCIAALWGVMCLSGCGMGGGSPLGSTGGATGASVSVSAVPSSPTAPAAAPTTGAIMASSGGAAGCSLTTYSPNFGAESDPANGLPNHLYHWNALPVQVYFVPGDYVTSDRKAQALAGFDWWGLATAQPGLYQETPSRSNAAVVVQFEARGQTGYGAITEYHFNSQQQMLDATITFNMTYLTDIASIVPVAAHEFGHALGIAGHSNDHGDVMSSSADVYTRTQLSTRDINTIQTAYCGLPVIGAGGSGTGGGASKSAAHTARRSAASGAVASSIIVPCRFDAVNGAGHP